MTVRASLAQLFVRNWPIKLAAGFFAVMLYVAVAAQQPLAQTFAMRLAIVVPPGRSVRQQPAGVAVVITGKGSEILKLRSFPRVIRKVIPDTFSASAWRLQLQPTDIDRKSTRLNSSHVSESRMPSSALKKQTLRNQPATTTGNNLLSTSTRSSSIR